VHDRDAVALGHGLHPGHDLGALGLEPVDVALDPFVQDPHHPQCTLVGVAGSVEQINVAAVESELPQPVDAVEVTADGVVGDRYAEARDLTLVEAEALEGLREDTGIELSAAEVRRQVLTRGIRLNDLVGERFRVGEVECVGQELCEPCNHLQGLTYPGVLRGLVHRGGLRADIVSGGRIAVGDEVMRISSPVNG
jgi:MOSC domain-containing protein YiiM